MIYISSFARSHDVIDAGDDSEAQRSSLHPQLFHAVLLSENPSFFIPSVLRGERREVLFLYFCILDFLCVVCVCVDFAFMTGDGGLYKRSNGMNQ